MLVFEAISTVVQATFVEHRSFHILVGAIQFVRQHWYVTGIPNFDTEFSDLVKFFVPLNSGSRREFAFQEGSDHVTQQGTR